MMDPCSAHAPLDGIRLLQQIWKLALLGLELRIATNVLLLDEYVWDGALLSDLLERVLNSGAVIYSCHVSLNSLLYIAPHYPRGRRSGTEDATYRLDQVQ